MGVSRIRDKTTPCSQRPDIPRSPWVWTVCDAVMTGAGAGRVRDTDVVIGGGLCEEVARCVRSVHT